MKAQAIMLLLFFCIGMNGHAAIHKFQPGQGKVSFLAKGRPALISIHGTGKGLAGELVEKEGRLTGKVSFRLETLTTGIDLRDEHMKNKYLQIQDHPEASLQFENFEMPKGAGKFKFSGDLFLHGVKQNIEGLATIVKEDDGEKVSAEFVIKLSQFKIDIPSFQGITVAEDVQIKIEALIATQI